jgi:hypothetical protein
MGLLMLKCPITGREFSTGIFADEETFQHLPDTVTKAAYRGKATAVNLKLK